MKLLENAELVDRVICLIKKRSTGDAATLAAKLCRSERSVHRLISEMRESGLPISYNTQCKSYIFDQDVTYEFRLTVGNLDLLKIKGGKKSCLDYIDIENI